MNKDEKGKKGKEKRKKRDREKKKKTITGNYPAASHYKGYN